MPEASKRIDKFLEKRIRYIVLSITFLLGIAECFWISNLNDKTVFYLEINPMSTQKVALVLE